MGDITIEASKVTIEAMGDSINGDKVILTLSDITSSGCADKALIEALGEEWVVTFISTEVLIASLASRGDEVSVAAQGMEEDAVELQQLLASRWTD